MGRSKSKTTRVRTTAEFSTTSEGCISLVGGVVCNVVTPDASGWMILKAPTGLEGYFPTSHTAPCDLFSPAVPVPETPPVAPKALPTGLGGGPVAPGTSKKVQVEEGEDAPPADEYVLKPEEIVEGGAPQKAAGDTPAAEGVDKEKGGEAEGAGSKRAAEGDAEEGGDAEKKAKVE